jgi:hypothetical protein
MSIYPVDAISGHIKVILLYQLRKDDHTYQLLYLDQQQCPTATDAAETEYLLFYSSTLQSPLSRPTSSPSTSSLTGSVTQKCPICTSCSAGLTATHAIKNGAYLFHFVAASTTSSSSTSSMTGSGTTTGPHHRAYQQSRASPLLPCGLLIAYFSSYYFSLGLVWSLPTTACSFSLVLSRERK